MRARGPLPGEIAPQAGCGGRRWYPLWGEDTRHQLLIFGDLGTAYDSVLDWATDQSDLIRPLVVTVQSPNDPGMVLDPTGALRRRYATTSSGGLYLVRPDGYIAARSTIDDITALTEYVDTFLTREDAQQAKAERLAVRP